jgi:hypothetical protein
MTPKQEDALLDYLQEVITPLIEQVLVKKLGQAMSFAKEELIQPKREWQDLTDKEVKTICANSQTIEWAILMAQSTLKEKNT